MALVLAGLGLAGAHIGLSARDQSVGQQINRFLSTQTVPEADPLLAALRGDLLTQFGLVDPTLLTASSPFSQAVAARRAQPGRDDLKNFAIGTAESVLRQIQADPRLREALLQEGDDALVRFGILGSERPGVTLAGLQRIAAAAGFESFRDLVTAEEQFQQVVPQRIAEQERLAGLSRGRTLQAQEGLATLLANLPAADASALAALRQDERERILRESDRAFDEQRGELLRAANFGGFNPGRAVGDLEERRELTRQSSDLDALSRAVALIQAQQGLAGTQAGLLTALDPAQSAQQAAIAAAQTLSAGQRSQFQGSPLAPTSSARAGASIPGAANILASFIGSAQQQQQIGQNQGIINSVFGQNAPASSGGALPIFLP